mgnify:CR=1 FL=1|jgi:hypothetical protein
MSKEIRKMIDKVKNFKQFVNEQKLNDNNDNIFNVEELIGKKVKVYFEPLSTTKENEELPYYYYQFKGFNSKRRQSGYITKVLIGDNKQKYYKDKYSVEVNFENGNIGIYRLRYVEVI